MQAVCRCLSTSSPAESAVSIPGIFRHICKHTKMDRLSLYEVYSSIARHLEESQMTWLQTGSRTAPTPGTSAKRAFEAMSIDYLDALQDLNHKIAGESANTSTMNGAYSWSDDR